MTLSHSHHRRDDDDPCTTLQLPFIYGSAREARLRLEADLADRGLRQTFIHDAALVIAELMANGLEHGQPNGDGLIDVSWCVEDEIVRISICDGGPSANLRPVEFTDASLRGRGLAIVDHLCDSWSVEHDEGLRVTAELRHDADVDDNRFAEA